MQHEKTISIDQACCPSKFGINFPTVWTNGKAEVGKSQRRERKGREEVKRADQRRERVRRKKMQVREKVEKSRITVLWLHRVEK